METEARATRATRGLRTVVVGVFVAALVAGMLLPVYTDEVGWRLQERAGFDGVDKMFTELCGPNSIAWPPFWMMPARWYSALFNGWFPQPLYVRLSGVLYALAWTGMLLALIGRVTDGAGERTRLTTLAAGFLSLGTMPLLLVWSRPEQPMLLAFTGALLIAFAGRPQGDADTPAGTAWWRSLAILALALVAMSYHLKAIFTIPLFLACLYFASRGRAAHVPRILAAALLVAAALWAADYWIHRLECPGDPAVRADAANNNTGAALVGARDWSQVRQLAEKALGNIGLVPYLSVSVPRDEPMSSWLPPDRISFSHAFAWFLGTVLVWAMVLLLAAGCLLAAARRAWRDRRLEPRATLAVVLLLVVLAWSATQSTRNVYEATFVVPMLVLAVVFALAARDRGRFAGAAVAASVGVGLLGLASIALVAAIYGPPLARATGERGYVGGQPFSISAFGYAGVERDILGAARLCGIDGAAGRRRLLIDDVTYFPFMQSHMPEHRYGLFASTVTTRDKIGYLRGIGSDGIIVSCSGLPPELRARARSRGQFCCLAPPGW